MRVKNIKNDASVLAFVTDNIRKAFEIKEKAKTEVIIKGKNAEFVAKFVQKRNIFAKMYICYLIYEILIQYFKFFYLFCFLGSRTRIGNGFKNWKHYK